MFDGELFGQQMVEIVRGYMEAEVAELRAENSALRGRLEALEAQDLSGAVSSAIEAGLAQLPSPVDAEGVRAIVDEAVSAIPPAHVGESVDPEVIRAMIEAHHVDVMASFSDVFDEKVASLPSRPTSEDIRGFIDEAVQALPPAKDGKSVEPEQVRAMVAEHVEAAVAALPVPSDGKDADMEAAFRRITEDVQRAAAAIPVPKDGKDGAGVADLLIDRDGALVATMTDGRIRHLGVVVGKDGKDGEHFTLDDFDIEQIGDRTFKFKFTRGEVCHAFEFAFPVVLDKGVYSPERAYEQGDAVTWGGSLWIAQQDTKFKPDTPDSGWRLAVKRGRDGKDAR